MTRLLISVKSVEEALIARYADVDLIDLKDPSVGALGALDVNVVGQVVSAIDKAALISATVGEAHTNTKALVHDIKLYASLGVDVIKIAVSDLFQQQDFFAEMLQLTAKKIKLVAVFFADKPLKLDLIATLKESGFYGAMLDTSVKDFSLLNVQSELQLKKFLDLTGQYQLVSGLSGSVSKDDLTALMALQPAFIGMRGGVCEGQDRASNLSDSKIKQIKGVLLKYNMH